MDQILAESKDALKMRKVLKNTQEGLVLQTSFSHELGRMTVSEFVLPGHQPSFRLKNISIEPITQRPRMVSEPRRHLKDDR